MVNAHSKSLKQSTIDIDEARTKHGHFSGFGLSHLHQDNSIRNKYAWLNALMYNAHSTDGFTTSAYLLAACPRLLAARILACFFQW